MQKQVNVTDHVTRIEKIYFLIITNNNGLKNTVAFITIILRTSIQNVFMKSYNKALKNLVIFITKVKHYIPKPLLFDT